MAAEILAKGCLFPIWALGFSVLAQGVADYPNKPIRILVAQEAGSAGDVGTRTIAPALGEALGQPLIVENRPGAGGALGMQVAMAAAPNGYTLMAVGSPQMVLPYAHKNLGYDILKDFVPIGRYSVSHNALVVPSSLPVSSVRELVALAKSKPGQLNMGTAGVGSASHLAGALFNAIAEIDSLVVPYKGGGGATNALIAGEIQYYVAPLQALFGQAKSGRLKVLGVGGDSRAPQLPEVPTIAEAGMPAFRSVGWGGILMPKGTPLAIASKVMEKLGAIIALPAVQQQLIATGVEPALLLGADFEKFIREDLARYGIAAKAANLRPE
ncbi:MAG: Bug family tripartite tricarboxylate transporter substrate binding protein [Burkholderiales bacterium]